MKGFFLYVPSLVTYPLLCGGGREVSGSCVEARAGKGEELVGGGDGEEVGVG